MDGLGEACYPELRLLHQGIDNDTCSEGVGNVNHDENDHRREA
jgi:hypothetical protein